MANSNRDQANLRSGCFGSERLACAQRALIVISLIIIMSLCSLATSSHIAQPPSEQPLHLNKSANTSTTTSATTTTTTAQQLKQRHQQPEASRSPTNANDNDYSGLGDLNRLIDDNEPHLADLDRLFSLGFERILRMIAGVDDEPVKRRFRRQLNEMELIKELNDTTPAPAHREQELVERETTPRGEEVGTHMQLMAPGETQTSVSSHATTQRQRSPRAKKQTSSTTAQPSYSSPSVTGDNPVGAYAMATTPASSVDSPQNVEVQVTNDQPQPSEGNLMNDLDANLAISTARPASKHSARKQQSSSDSHHYKLSKVPGPEHNPLKDIRGSNSNDETNQDEPTSQDQATVNSLAEAIELASRQPEVGADDAAFLDQLTKPNFMSTNLPLKRDKRPVQSRDEQQQSAEYQQSYQSNQRQPLFPADSLALTNAPPLAPYTFDQNQALLSTGNLRQSGGERVINSFSNLMAGSDFGPNTATANASRLSRPQPEHNWSVPLVSGAKSGKSSRTRTSDMTNDIGGAVFMSGNNNNNDDLSMLFHNSKMQNKRAGLALAAENLKNNFLLPYQQPFSGRFSLTGNKKAQQQQQLVGAMSSNAAASAPFRQYLNPLVAASANDQTRGSQESIYGDGASSQLASALLAQQGANQNPVLGMLRVAPNQLNAAFTGALQQQQHQQRTPYAPLVRRNSPLALLTGSSLSSAGTTDYLPYSSPSAYLAAAAAARYSRQQQQQPQHRTISAYQHRIGRHEPGVNGANANYDDGGGGGGSNAASQPAASVATTSTSDPMWSDTQNHEEDYQQSPQTIQITAVPNGLGLANPGFVNGFNGFNNLGGWNGWGGPWGGRQVVLLNKQPQQVGTEWRSWLIPVAIILALPLILGALFIPVFLKSVMFLIQILQMLGLLMPPSQLASHLLSNTHGSQSG